MSVGCGCCNFCCKALGVADIQKPARMLCWWTNVHGGCERHSEKTTDPSLLACHQFQCLWLASQNEEDPDKRMFRIMRPDQCHVMFGPQDKHDDTLLYVHVDPDYPDAWMKPAIRDYLDGIISRGGKLELYVGESHFTYSNSL